MSTSSTVSFETIADASSFVITFTLIFNYLPAAVILSHSYRKITRTESYYAALKNKYQNV